MLELRLDDVVRLRKPHPCGSYDWRVVRLGADIGLKCLRCQRRVLLPIADVERRARSVVRDGPDELGR
jgi:hypothetical protein